MSGGEIPDRKRLVSEECEGRCWEQNRRASSQSGESWLAETLHFNQLRESVSIGMGGLGSK